MSSVRGSASRAGPLALPSGRGYLRPGRGPALDVSMLLSLLLACASGDPETARFRVVNCFAEEERAQEAMQAAEAAVPVVLERLGVASWAPADPRTLQLYSDFA